MTLGLPSRIRAKLHGTVVHLRNSLGIKNDILCRVLVLDATTRSIFNIRNELDVMTISSTAGLVLLNLFSSQHPDATESGCPQLLGLNYGGKCHFLEVFWFSSGPRPNLLHECPFAGISLTRSLKGAKESAEQCLSALPRIQGIVN
jgi:hypothetical protein